MLRKLFYEPTPQNEKDYADGRRLYIVAESANALINELAGGTFLVAVLSTIQITDGMSGFIRSCGTIAMLFQLLTMIHVQKMKKRNCLCFFVHCKKFGLGYFFSYQL